MFSQVKEMLSFLLKTRKKSTLLVQPENKAHRRPGDHMYENPGNPLSSMFSSPLTKQVDLEIPALTKPGFPMVNHKLREEFPCS